MSRLREELINIYDDLEFIDAYDVDEAIVGVTNDFRVVYDYDYLVEALLKCPNVDGYEGATEIVDDLFSWGKFTEHYPIVMDSVEKYR